MNQALRHIIIFTFIVLFIHLTLLIIFQRWTGYEERWTQERKHFETSYRSNHTLIFGHSKPRHAWLMDSLSQSSNFCLGGERVIRTYYKFKVLAGEMDNQSNYLILPLDAPYVSLENINSDIRSYYWAHYQDYPEVGRQVGEEWTYTKVYWRAKFIPYQWQLIFWLKKLSGTWLGPVDPDVYEAADDTMKRDIAEQLVKHYRSEQSFKDRTAIDYLQKLVRLALSKGMKVIFIRYPETSFYRLALGNLAIQQKEQTKWLNEFEKDVTVVDMRSLMDDCPTCFKDVQHLNEKGATLFTSRAKQLLWDQLHIKM